MSCVITPTGVKFRTNNLHGQLKALRYQMTNKNEYGVKVKDFIGIKSTFDSSRSFDKRYNPFLRSYGSADKFTRVNNQMLGYAKRNFGVKKLWELKPEHIQDYVRTELIERYGMAKNTLQQHSAMIGKLEIGIKEFLGYSVDFGNRDIASGRWVANSVAKELSDVRHHSAYKDVNKLVSSIKDSKDKVFAMAQANGGFRFSELQYSRKENLHGIVKDKITGEEVGVIHVEGKGGRERNCFIAVGLYEKIEGYVEKQGHLKVNYEKYLRGLQEASKETGLSYSGSHGLRCDFAQDRYDNYISGGYSNEDALKGVSVEMGHDRTYETQTYLGR